MKLWQKLESEPVLQVLVCPGKDDFLKRALEQLSQGNGSVKLQTFFPLAF